MNLQSIRQTFNEKTGEQKKIKRDLESDLTKKNKIERDISVSEKALQLITAVAQLTQQELRFRIEEPVSLALNAVYPENPYKFVADFQITNSGPIQCHLGFERGGFVIKPMESSGGGPISVASFALKIGALTLEKPSPRKVLIMDEDFKFVSRNKLPLVGDLLNEMTNKLGIQIILITHIPELVECANRVISVGIKKGESYIKNVIDNP